MNLLSQENSAKDEFFNKIKSRVNATNGVGLELNNNNYHNKQEDTMNLDDIGLELDGDQ